MAITPSPKKVKVVGQRVDFPFICPHCLRPASITLGIQSPEKMVGHYVACSRWRHYTIQVPFCTEFGRQVRTARTVGFTSIFVLVAAFIAFIIASGIALEGWQAGLLLLSFIGITWVPSLIVRPERYIKLLAARTDSIEFRVRDGDYAKMLERSNRITSCGDYGRMEQALDWIDRYLNSQIELQSARKSK